MSTICDVITVQRTEYDLFVIVSIVAFFLTLNIFGAGFVALFIPWRFILLWTTRLLVWVGLGPWMRILDLFFHEETERQKVKASKKAMNIFHEQRKVAKILREHAIKVSGAETSTGLSHI